jgi:thiamine biosynthesis lipoprotein
MLAALNHPHPRAYSRLSTVPEWFEEWEQCLSRFREDSELNRLNGSGGVETPVSYTLYSVFQSAREAERRSCGLVTPAVLDALLEAGYDRSFDDLRPTRSYGSQPAPVLQNTFKSVKLNASIPSLQLPVGLRLDFGGIAKGWAAHQAMQRLKVYGPALVDAGGDIAISGLQEDGQPWPVGVADPHHPDSDLEVLKLGRCGVATSGRDYRRWKQDGKWKHHLIDPRTGLPAETDVLSSTVIAPTVMEAEMAAKIVLISGSHEGMAWLDSNPSFAGLLVLEDGQRIYSKRFEQYVWR